jgi:pyruvate carboxylase
VRYRNAGTFEFLVAGDGASARHVFIEANPRLQVEHTVTEEVLGLDLVRLQLQLASGESLAGLGLDQAGVPAPRGFAIQVRINTEIMSADGTTRPSGGRLTAFELPSGFGVRTDTCGHVGYETNPHFDSLLAKVIGHSPSPRFADAVARTGRALAELHIAGVETNLPFLRNLLAHPAFIANRIDTQFVEENLAELTAPPAEQVERGSPSRTVGSGVGGSDPLAVLTYGKSAETSDLARGPGTARPTAAPQSGLPTRAARWCWRRRCRGRSSAWGWRKARWCAAASRCW